MVIAEDAHEKLAVADAKLGGSIQEKLDLSCVYDSKIGELMRCIRSQISGLISGLPDKEMSAMELGLAHSLSRYKLKFSPDKIDTMIVQAVSLLDDLDKELNNYIMRCREWYGWHFPELGKIITDNLAFVRTIDLMGFRENAKVTDMSEVLPEEVEKMVAWMDRLRCEDGAFTMHVDGELDIRGVYCALSTARLLNIYSPQLFHNTDQWLLRCQSYEGGFGGVPGMEAHGGYSFCGLAALMFLNKGRLCNIDALLKWAANRQMRVEGGFQGRTNKLVDGCYSI